MKLFVAKLPQNLTSERLKALFESYGQVIDAKVIMDRETGMSKCYGFVEMANEEDGKSAIENLNGRDMDGKEVLVKESDPAPRSNDRPRGNFKPGGGGRPSFGGGDRRSNGPRPDRWNSSDDRSRSSNRYQDQDRQRRRHDDDYDDKPRRKRL